MKRPNIKDNNYGHGDHALMWYSDAQDQYIDYLESKLKSDLLHNVSCCPKCYNPYFHLHKDDSKSCEDCGHKWG